MINILINILDTNECTERSDNCDEKEHSTCHNTDGAFECICDSGYREESDTCQGWFVQMTPLLMARLIRGK
jgi:hypothetical protein